MTKKEMLSECLEYIQDAWFSYINSTRERKVHLSHLVTLVSLMWHLQLISKEEHWKVRDALSAPHVDIDTVEGMMMKWKKRAASGKKQKED